MGGCVGMCIGTVYGVYGVIRYARAAINSMFMHSRHMETRTFYHEKSHILMP